jgi:anti-sigma regulatory factor (Ser/Thr protein kinase)
VVEVSGLRAGAASVRAFFAEVRAAVADWPVGELLLCGGSLGAGAEWAGSGMPVWRSPAEALAQTVPVAPVDVPLEAAAGAARQAREVVTETCARRGVPELAGAGSVAVTEMVNNVVAHARTPMTLRVSVRNGTLRLAVRDWSARRPAYAGLVPPTSAGGRGLLLIDAVARRWGDTPVSDGKVVWAVLHPEDAAGY